MSHEVDKNSPEAKLGGKNGHAGITYRPAFFKTHCAGCGEIISGAKKYNVCCRCYADGIRGREPTHEELVAEGLWRQCDMLGCGVWFRAKTPRQRFCCSAHAVADGNRRQAVRVSQAKYDVFVDQIMSRGKTLCPYQSGDVDFRDGCPPMHAQNCPMG